MRLIDADALVESLQKGMSALEETQAKYDDERNALIGLAMTYIGATVNAVAGMPTIDAVPVVRCRDCQWFDANGDYYDAYCDKNGISVEEDFFCADGERKDGADDGRTC